ncbi:MAG: tRNA 2-thiouridine(34) synthase MnmA [Deltaproteobacteria bacterium]|nr:tRNA 2-thiouridine(34) synthase MnmA [Deltaproteobacteria bacterium]MBW2137817.1 tRNA 2-thiouridine(34) synthase MnmA [Deltaproteobacteria bacterium]
MKGNKEKARIAVGLSGGVDSSVAAAILLEEGHDIIGLTMEIFDGSSSAPLGTKGHACYGPGERHDVERARALCRDLGIPFFALDLKEEYKRYVLDYFRKEYLSGRTPNPCIVCNRRLKFDFLLQRAKEAGIQLDFFATGHYAQLEKREDGVLLKKAVDSSKDQTYFLWALDREQLSRALFPLGTMTKEEVKEKARSLGLETADMPESQDFVEGGDYSPLFRENEIRPGDIVDKKGRVLGRHQGIIHYTIGQRRGLGISSQRPLYVTAIDAANNRILVGGKEEVFSPGLIASQLNLPTLEELREPLRVVAKIRLQHRGADARVFPLPGGSVRVVFEEPQMSVTPGQSVVFYIEDVVLGGGIIDRALV